jgi:inner membrane protein
VVAWLPLTLLVLGLVLLLLEVVTPGWFVAVPGLTLVVAALVLWVAPAALRGPLGYVGLPAVLVLSTVATLLVYRRLGTPAKLTTVLQDDELPQQPGTVTETIPAPPGEGEVLVGGRHWPARAANPIPRGCAITVLRVEGHTLVVEEP